MANRIRTKSIEVPENKKGFIIGRHHTGLEEISRVTNAIVFVSNESGEICARGTDEQIKLAEEIIQDKLEKKSYNESTLTLAIEGNYAGVVIGKRGRNLHNIETKSGTKIQVFFPKKDQDVSGCAKFTIIGSPENCKRAKALMMESIASAKDRMLRKELGGVQFAILDHADQNAHFGLKKDKSDAPKSNGYMKGERYRIEAESKSSDIPDVISETALSSVHDILLESLRNLHQVKDEKELMMDLWCHLGKAFVHNVDEGEETEGLSIDAVRRQLSEVIKLNKVTQTDDDGRWRVSFEEGIDPEYNTTLEQLARQNEDSFLRHHHTQWRYDYEFISTSSGRSIRFKLWENLKDTEPPPEAKNHIKQVFVVDHGKSVVGWLCYSSTAIIKGDIMTPSSMYDWRLKLTTDSGRRFVPQENGDEEEENEILCEYLSKCTLRTEDGRRHLVLPGEPPEGFGCSFYRSAEEKIFKYSEGDKETFRVTVLDEQGWDSDFSEKRDQKQFGITVASDTWSKELLSGEWEPEAIVNKLREFMEFFYTFRVILFGEK